MKEFIDETSYELGTPINRASMMAVQGYANRKVTFPNQNSVVETFANGLTRTTTFNANGSIVEVLRGEKTITKKVTFNSDGSISEVIS